MTTQGVGWASEEASDLVAPPLNLVLYMHLRIFAYTSNVLIASFKYMELMLASGTLKNLMFLPKSRLSTDRASVMKLTYSTFQLWRCITVLIELRRSTGSHFDHRSRRIRVMANRIHFGLPILVMGGQFCTLLDNLLTHGVQMVLMSLMVIFRQWSGIKYDTIVKFDLLFQTKSILC